MPLNPIGPLSATNWAIPITGVRNQNGGFTLIELLIAVVVVTIGLLGMAGLQTTGLTTNQSAYLRTQATTALADIIDRMRANPEGLRSGQYDAFTTTGTVPAAQSCISRDTGCNPTELAAYDIREWAKLFTDVQNQGSDYRPLLPGATGSVVRIAGTNNFTVQITWQETDWSDNRTKAVQNKNLVMNVSL
jgi:type IV pilus assembly protein PilV